MKTLIFFLWFFFAVVSQNCLAVTYPSQGECEQQTQQRCGSVMCDYIPPGKTFEEVCGKDFKKGWTPSPYLIKINSEEMGDIKEIILQIDAPFSKAVMVIKGNGQVSYEATDQNGKKITEYGKFSEGQMLNLGQILQNNNFFQMKERSVRENEMEDGSHYLISVGIRIFQFGARQKTIFEGIRSVSCHQDNCEPGFLEIKNVIGKLWGRQILEIGI